MTLVRYQQPWSLHRDLLNEVNRWFDGVGANDPSTAATADWSPAVDINEYSDRFVLRADVPGVDPASIDVTLEQGVLTLSGARVAAAEEENLEQRRVERASGKFYRRFTLPDTADSEAVTASGKHGVLEVVIPKRAQVQPRKISVAA